MKRILGLLMAVTMVFGASAFAATPNVKKTDGKAAVKKKLVRKPKRHRRHHRSRKMMKTTIIRTETKTQSNP